jgi:uncharacterized membrane protein (TIGR02234 family)
MPEPRRTFAPVVLGGLASGVLAAVASSRTWLEYADPDPRIPDAVLAAGAGGQVPLATALSLVVLACWGVLLVTRRMVRRMVAALGVVAAVGVVATVVYARFALPDQQPEPTALAGRDPGALSWTAWYWAAVVASVVSVAATALALRWVRHWPEMGRRYDAPAAAADTQEQAPPPPEERSNLELWKAMDEGQDPTA